jgi:branched-subunit amino acid ABC-type transport system permease component
VEKCIKGTLKYWKVKMMDWIRLICAVISISIFLYLMFQTSRFGKELKKATNDDRSISKRFFHKWDRRFSRGAILIIIGCIFGILAIFLSY